MNEQSTTAEADDREAARERSAVFRKARGLVRSIRLVLVALGILSLGACVFLLKLRIAVPGIAWLDALTATLLIGNCLLLLAIAVGAWRCHSHPRLVALGVVVMESALATLLIPLYPVAQMSPELLVLAGLRLIVVAVLWLQFVRASGIARLLVQYPELDPSRRVIGPERAAGAAHQTSERRARAARRTTWNTARRVFAIGGVAGALVSLGIWWSSPMRDLSASVDEFVVAWNGDVASVSQLLANPDFAEEWPETVQHMEWRQRKPVLEGEWEHVNLDDGTLATAHTARDGRELLITWGHDRVWRLQSIGVPLRDTCARFQDAWNERDIEALPWFFARQKGAKKVLRKLLEEYEWAMDWPELGEGEQHKDMTRVYFPLDDGMLQTRWRMRGGRWRITTFKPPLE